MSCASPIRSLLLASREAAWSKGGSDQDSLSDIFVLSDAELENVGPELKAVRATVTITNRTNNASVEVVFQTSSDGCVATGTAVELVRVTLELDLELRS